MQRLLDKKIQNQIIGRGWKVGLFGGREGVFHFHKRWHDSVAKRRNSDLASLPLLTLQNLQDYIICLVSWFKNRERSNHLSKYQGEA